MKGEGYSRPVMMNVVVEEICGICVLDGRWDIGSLWLIMGDLIYGCVGR